MIKNEGLWRIRIFLILTTITLFVGCQKDDEASPQLEIHENLQTTTSNVTIEKIPSIMNYLSTKGNNRGQFTITKSGNATRSNDPDLIIGELQTKEIIQVTDQYDRKNYTFLLSSIESVDSTLNSTFNLVVKESHEVGFFSYIIEYRPESNWIYNYRGLQDFSNYTGDILYYTVEGIYKAKATMFEGNFQTLYTRTPCNPTSDDGEGNSGGNEGQDSNNDTSDTTDTNDTNDNSDGDTNGDDTEGGLDACGFEVHNPPPDCGCLPNLVITCDDNQNVVNGDIFDDFIRTTCGDVPEICHSIEGDPCDCNLDGSGCEDMPAEGDSENTDSNPTIGVIFDIELIRDCRLLENLADSPSFQQRMQELVANNSGNTEIGYYGRNNNNGDMNYPNDDENRFESEVGKREIIIPTPQDLIDSYIHNHFNNGEGALSVFSPGDLFTLYTLLSLGRIADADDFVMVMTSPGISNSPDDDTLYAITISSVSDFLENGANSLISLDLAENLLYFAGLRSGVAPIIAEKRLVSIINDNDLGLKLFRGNKDDLTEWTEIRRRNNGEFRERNCN